MDTAATAAILSRSASIVLLPRPLAMTAERPVSCTIFNFFIVLQCNMCDESNLYGHHTVWQQKADEAGAQSAQMGL